MVPYSVLTGAHLKRIDFGYADAKEEADDPRLLIEGYYEIPGSILEAVQGRRFLFLGYKGCGKTAIAHHLRLKAQRAADLFVDIVNLGEFPYNSLSNLIGEDPTSRYTVAWNFLLLIRLFSSFSRDEGAWPEATDSVVQTLGALERLNLLITPDFTTLVADTKKVSLSIGITEAFKLAGEISQKAQQSPIPFLVDRLKLVTQSISGSTRHLLIIDGLDDILSAHGQQFDSLMGLILAASDLNSYFRSNGTPFKVLVLCRTDLFDRLSDANKNKIRQDSALELTWFNEPRDPANSQLLQLANRRAMLVNVNFRDLLKFFPDRVSGRPTWMFLLENTRHTPRDFLQVLKYIQAACGTDIISDQQILSGARNYSQNYFLGEIRDELDGYLGGSEIDGLLRLMGTLRYIEFTHEELKRNAADHSYSQALDLDRCLELLFECSAIGNVRYDEQKKYYHFKYRSRASSLNLKQSLVLHAGLWKALNVV